MAENLRATKYNDGTPLPNVTGETEWNNLTTPAYCWYDNFEASFKNPYGALYNWHTVYTGKLSPTGWHVPTDIEWQTLIDTLGGNEFAGGKLKEIGTMHWDSPNTGATNERGFTALPGGCWQVNFGGMGTFGFFWTYTSNNQLSSYRVILDYRYESVQIRETQNYNGYSVRCIKD